MVAADFLEEQKPVLDEEGGLKRYNELELFTYLKRAYTVLQKDRPIFFSRKEIFTIKDENTYSFKDEIIDIDYLNVEDIPYEKVDVSKFHEKCFSQCSGFFYSVDMNKIYIYPTPKSDGLKISLSYSRIKELKNLDSDLLLNLAFEEALRLMFLSKALEKVPDRDNKNISMHYLKLYKQEISEAKRASKKRHRNIRSNFQII